MENGDLNIEGKFAGLAVSGAADPAINNGNDGLFQVMKAVEAAEATIKQQVEENIRLTSELKKRNEELEKYKSGVNGQKSQSTDQWDDHVSEPHTAARINVGLGNRTSGTGNMDINSGPDLVNSHGFQKDLMQNDTDRAIHTQVDNFLDTSQVNGSLKGIARGQMVSDSSGFSQFFSSRSALEGDSDLQLGVSGRGSMAMAEVNNSNGLKQDLLVKIREHEEEIMQLRKHLTEYSIKEAQISNDKYVMEKRISYMRMAFDQQQQDLVDAASKAISYRQEIMEENVRLTYALQSAQQERSTFISSLMPLLAEYSLQPPVADAQSIVSNVKVLFRHLQEQLLITEGKLKDSQYQLAPWRSDVNPSTFTQSPLSPNEIQNGLELVPQSTYSNGKMLSSDHQASSDGDLLSHPQSGLDDMRNSEPEGVGSYPPLASRNMTSQELPAQFVATQAELHAVRNDEENVSKKVTFGDLVRSSEMDEPDTRVHHSDRDPSVNWTSKGSAYPMNLDDPNSSYSPYLPPVLEEPSSSYSEAADDDPPPAIEGLQISGEAFPGRQLQACGYSINGTTSCNFEWVRHSEDGSFNYIDGAKQPNYLITADDIDTYLAIEVQPLDDRKRKGELVKVFANEHRKIACDPEMQSCIEKTLYSGHASYKLTLATGFLDIWEPATLSVKREGYSIKCSGPSAVFVSEKFTSSTVVSIPYGSPTEFSIVDSQGIERVLKVDNSSIDISGSRDTIVLTLRLFIIKAGEKKKGRKRNLFFNK